MAKTCKAKIVKGKRAGEVCGKKTYEGDGGDPSKCWGHQSKDVKERKGFGGAQEGSGPKKLDDPFDVAREAVRQHAELLIRPHFKVLGYDIEIKHTADGPELLLTELKDGGAKLFGESKDGVVKMSRFEDLGAQIAAAEKLIDRLWGRPKVAVEHSGGQKFEIVDTTPIQDPGHAAAVAQILARARANVN